MAQTRYNNSTTVGAGADALQVRWSIDLVDFPYVGGVRTVDATTLAGVGYVVENINWSISANGITSEQVLSNITFKIYDTAGRAAWSVLSAGLATNRRLHFILWHYDGTRYVRDFYGAIDKTSLDVKIKTITQSGVTYDSVITFTAMDLAKTVFQEYFLDITVPGATVLGPIYQTVTNFWLPYFWWYNKRSYLSVTKFNDYGWTDFKFARMYHVLQAFADVLLSATDFTTAFQTTNNLDHVGVTIRQAGTYPNPTTIKWGAGASSPNDTLMMAVLAYNKHTFIDNPSVPPAWEYSFQKQTTVYDALKLFANSLACEFAVVWDDSISQITLSFKSLLSPTITALLAGNPEIIPLEDTLDIFPWAFQIDDASCAVMRPQGISAQTQDDQPHTDTFNPTVQSSVAKNGSAVNGRTNILSAWIDDGGAAGIATPFAENLVCIFDSQSTHVNVIPADYSMADVNSYSGWPYANPFTIMQGYAGGTLQGGTAILRTAPHWQTMLAKGYYSLYCGGVADNDGLVPTTAPKGIEKIEFQTVWTLAMINALQNVTTYLYVRVRTDALYNFLVIGVEYNLYDPERKIKFTAIRDKYS